MQNYFLVVSLHRLSLCVCLVFCLAFLAYKNKFIVRSAQFSWTDFLLHQQMRWNAYSFKCIKVSGTSIKEIYVSMFFLL